MKPKVNLLGRDGNAFAIIAACHKAAFAAGWPNERWEGVYQEMIAGDYNHLLATALEHFEVV